MSAREIIANEICQIDNGLTAKYYKPASFAVHASSALRGLSKAGYRILAPGELDPETVERCAQTLERGVYRSKHDAEQARELVGYLRRLIQEGR